MMSDRKMRKKEIQQRTHIIATLKGSQEGMRAIDVRKTMHLSSIQVFNMLCDLEASGQVRFIDGRWYIA